MHQARILKPLGDIRQSVGLQRHGGSNYIRRDHPQITVQKLIVVGQQDHQIVRAESLESPIHVPQFNMTLELLIERTMA